VACAAAVLPMQTSLWSAKFYSRLSALLEDDDRVVYLVSASPAQHVRLVRACCRPAVDDPHMCIFERSHTLNMIYDYCPVAGILVSFRAGTQ
jgi:hypothetical protein